MKRLYILLIIQILFTPVYAQGKSTVEPEFDVETESETKKDNPVEIQEKEIIIEGEDEQLLQNRKKDSKGLIPGGQKNADWDDAKDLITHKEKQGVKKIEKRSQVQTEYGSYRSYGLHIYLTKKDQDGIYLLDYTRKKEDAQGFGPSDVFNSETSIDSLKLTGGFDINKTYKVIMKTNYIDNLHGLQGQSSYDQQFKRAGFFETRAFRQTDDQKLSLAMKGVYSGSSVTPLALSEKTSKFSKVETAIDWQYIWASRNSLNIGTDLWYAENKTYDNSAEQYYRAGDFYAWNIFPLYKNEVTEESIRWQVDFTAGFQVFFSQGMQPVIGPVVALDNFFGNWHSKLSLERRGKIPDYISTVIVNPYFKPQHYTAPEDAWLSELKNHITIDKNMSVKLTLGFDYYNSYYNPNLQPDGLYNYSSTGFRYAYVKSSLEHNLTENFFYESGIKYEYQVEKVFLRPQMSGFLKTHFVPEFYDITLEFEYRY